MTEIHNVFISHVSEDEPYLHDLKNLLLQAGIQIRDSSITSENPNNAHNEQYIKYSILAPRMNWAGAVIVVISHNTALSDYVNWEIKYAIEHGKRVVGVFLRGATDADIPEELGKCGDAAVVGWRTDRVIDAINGNINEWDDPETELPRDPQWRIIRYRC